MQDGRFEVAFEGEAVEAGGLAGGEGVVTAEEGGGVVGGQEEGGGESGSGEAWKFGVCCAVFCDHDLVMSIALVTGASRGVGRGVALGLAAADFTVFATGRSVESADLPPSIVRLRCDHTQDAETALAFQRISEEAGGLDILVNSAWGGYERMVEDGKFTWSLPFWQQPAHRWSSMMDAGVRAAFFASAHAAPMMISRRKGLIVNKNAVAAYAIPESQTSSTVNFEVRQASGCNITFTPLFSN
jgi:NADP-dependent 3-hydroxy acid dehydrogenase YdfG